MAVYLCLQIGGGEREREMWCGGPEGGREREGEKERGREGRGEERVTLAGERL